MIPQTSFKTSQSTVSAAAKKTFAATAIGLSACFAAASIAGEPIAVTALPQPSVADWKSKVAVDLDHQLESIYLPPVQRARLPFGFVAVRFQLDETGKAHDITVSRKSGSYALNSIARQVISKLRNTYPLPAGVPADQLYEAHIIIAPDHITHDRMLAEARAHTARLARAPDRKNVMTFALGR